MKNDQNTDLTNQNVESGGPIKMNLPMETTKFYAQEYRDITEKHKVWKN